MKLLGALAVLAVFAGGIVGGFLAEQLDGVSAQDRGVPVAADTVDGYSANQIVRAASASTDQITVPAGATNIVAATAQMKVPKNGWVIAIATGLFLAPDWEATYSLRQAASCSAPVGADEQQLFVGENSVPLSLTRAFKAVRGTHDFSLCVRKSNPATGTADLDEIELVLLYVPFDFDGGKP